MLDFQSEVKAKIAEADPQHPMDSGPFKGNVDEMGQLLLFLNLMANYTLYVVKVSGSHQRIRNAKDYEAGKKSFAMFFVRLLRRDDQEELHAIRKHTRTACLPVEELLDMYQVFLPQCPKRPIKMEQLPFLDTESLGEPWEIIAAKLFLLDMELKSDCIISAVPPNDEKHPINAYDLGKFTSGRRWVAGRWILMGKDGAWEDMVECGKAPPPGFPANYAKKLLELDLWGVRVQSQEYFS